VVFKRIVGAVQLLAAGFALATVVLLFTRQPPTTSGATPAADPGAGIFADRCASCHGANGDGGTAPVLTGVVATRYPDVEDQVALVRAGKGAMPAFASSLSPDEIRDVVAYTRRSTGTGPIGGGTAAGPQVDAAEVYRVTCAGCHDDDGRGSYANGVDFRGGSMKTAYPNIEDEIAAVTHGKGAMAGFEGKLTPEEIAAVVEYTREHF
jgi:mono/diheme cytochrome c family protein